MKKWIPAGAALLPFLAFAQNVSNVLTTIGNLVKQALPIVAGLALLAFFWGLARFIFAQGKEDAKKQGKDLMIWGAIALFVMVSIWGIVRFIQTSLGVEDVKTIQPPTVNF
jgi:hypothetical protein